MEVQNVKKLLLKLDQILSLYEGNDALSQSEKELMLDYLRRIYTLVLRFKTEDETEVIGASEFEKILGSKVQAPGPSSTPKEKIEQIQREEIKSADSFVQTPNLVPPHMDTKVQEASHYPVIVSEIPPAQSFKNVSQQNQYDQLFDHLKISDLSDKLELVPLKDIRSGMGLNERILAQNELFGGDKVAFDQTLNDLNNCGNFEEARSLLCERIIPVYHWDQPDKERFVDSFIKLVQRRYL